MVEHVLGRFKWDHLQMEVKRIIGPSLRPKKKQTICLAGEGDPKLLLRVLPENAGMLVSPEGSQDRA